MKPPHLLRRGFHRAAALAFVHCDQAALLHIELFLLVDRPLVKSTGAERFTPRYLLARGLLEADNLTHNGNFRMRDLPTTTTIQK